MAKITQLYPGCTAQEILDTINALIAAITDGAGQSISYNDLTDKPTLNVRLSAIAEALEAAQAELAGKLDKDLSNLDLITYMGGSASILVLTSDNRLCRLSTKDLASYTGIVNATANSSQESSLKTQRKTLPLTGDQNGSNLVFACTSGYTLGTSALYLNGNRLYAGTDYKEDNSHQITFLTYIPEAADIILFEAIPLADART